ncbi:phosphatase PAP2/dual specificity phosphatase family protein [Herbaspirillum seropedicae]|uniref:phosphatase PAP2/dual specificity phosphatase family protein n=1 Tax=Herbaspirillum seropedicae TaxID=964 RepID=UPI003F8D0678
MSQAEHLSAVAAPAAPAAPSTPLPWKRGVAWLLLLGPLFFLSYGFANHAAAARASVPSFFYGWERHIPFLPWTILPYWSIDLLYGFSFLCCRTARETDRHALRLLTTQVIAVACFLAFPLRFAFERPATDGLFGALFASLTAFDLPYNQAPSLHIALLVLIWVQFARLRASWPWRWLIHGWALLIGLSVLTTWQHHFIDIPTGAMLGLFCLWLWPDEGRTPLQRDGQGSSRRTRLALAYGLGAAVALGLAYGVRPLAALLGWLALALAIVAWNYAYAGAAGFQKRDGRRSLAAAWLLAPHALGAWINARLWTRRHPQPDAITDDVWLGPLPGKAGMSAGRFAALCDLSAELPAPRGHWRYAGHPWLDLVAPEADQLLAAARSIESLRGHGPVLVACALGYSRSAGAVAAWLCLSRRCPDMAGALALLAERRPAVVINDALRERLLAVEQRLLKENPMPELRQGPGGDAANDAAGHDIPHEDPQAARKAAYQAAHQAEITAALLGLSRPLDATSRMLTIAALVVLILLAVQPEAPSLWIPLTLSILFGIAEYVFALRCAFDAPLFASWARRWEQGILPPDDLAAFDVAIRESGLGHQPTPTRPLADRTAGARRLLRYQCRCLAGQIGGWLGALGVLFIF